MAIMRQIEKAIVEELIHEATEYRMSREQIENVRAAAYNVVVDEGYKIDRLMSELLEEVERQASEGLYAPIRRILKSKRRRD